VYGRKKYSSSRASSEKMRLRVGKEHSMGSLLTIRRRGYKLTCAFFLHCVYFVHTCGGGAFLSRAQSISDGQANTKVVGRWVDDE